MKDRAPDSMLQHSARERLHRFALAAVSFVVLTGCSSGHDAHGDSYVGRVKTVDAATITDWMSEGREFTIVDVRSEGEYDSDGHAPGSELHPWSIYNRDPERNKVFVQEMRETFRPDETIVLLCSHGMRASQAAAALQEQAGFTEVYVFPGGFEGHHMAGYPAGDGWKSAGLPVEDW